MTTYIDIGVVRIQRYLAKPRHLRTQRGGSVLVAFATNKIPAEYVENDTRPVTGTEWDPVNYYCFRLEGQGYAGWQRTQEAGDIAGVVSIENPERVDEKDLHTIVELLASYLREKLPNAELEAYQTCSDKGYYEVYEEMHVGPPFLVALPLENDYPGLLPCDECGATPVVKVKNFPGGDRRRMCADCWQREDDEGRVEELEPQRLDRMAQSDAESGEKPKPVAPTFLIEGELQEAITAYRGRKELVRVADDFSDLADLQQADRTNHLATVWIDGDGIGQLFKDIPVEDRGLAASTLSEAVRTALIEATKHIDEPRYQAVPVIPHVRGGDDVLVTLLATNAWRFVLKFLEEFEGATRTIGATASASIVFARQNFPFAAQLDRAEELLAHTKRRRHACSKKTSFVGWVDLTREKSVNTPEYFLPLGDIEATEDELDNLAQVSATQREAWIRILAEQAPGVALDRIFDDAQRSGKLPLVDQMFRRNDSADLIRERLEMLRWWNHEEA